MGYTATQTGSGFLINEDTETYALDPFIQQEIPINAATVQVRQTKRNISLILSPLVDLSSLTLQLPLEANTRLGQKLELAANKAIGTLNWAGASVLNGPASLNTGDHFTFEKTGVGTWMLCQ